MAEVPTDPRIVTIEPGTVTVVREVVALDALPEFFHRAIDTVVTEAGRRGVALAGPPVALYHGMPTETVDVAVGFPTEEALDGGGVSTAVMPGGRAVEVAHVGPYATLDQTYARLMTWFGEQGVTPGHLMWETYLTEPDDAAPEKTITLLTWPLD